MTLINKLIKKYGRQKLTSFLLDLNPHLNKKQKKLNLLYIQQTKLKPKRGKTNFGGSVVEVINDQLVYKKMKEWLEKQNRAAREDKTGVILKTIRLINDGKEMDLSCNLSGTPEQIKKQIQNLEKTEEKRIESLEHKEMQKYFDHILHGVGLDNNIFLEEDVVYPIPWRRSGIRDERQKKEDQHLITSILGWYSNLIRKNQESQRIDHPLIAYKSWTDETHGRTFKDYFVKNTQNNKLELLQDFIATYHPVDFSRIIQPISSRPGYGKRTIVLPTLYTGENGRFTNLEVFNVLTDIFPFPLTHEYGLPGFEDVTGNPRRSQWLLSNVAGGDPDDVMSVDDESSEFDFNPTQLFPP